jgi:hypothetical protein
MKLFYNRVETGFQLESNGDVFPIGPVRITSLDGEKVGNYIHITSGEGKEKHILSLNTQGAVELITAIQALMTRHIPEITGEIHEKDEDL